jgi:large subunit ribosomal protein L20
MSAPARLAYKRKILFFARGFYGTQKNCWGAAVRAVHRAWQKGYVGRKQKKRTFRAEWIQRINAASRQFGLPYSQLVRFLPSAGVDLNRKVLSDLAAAEPYAFRALVGVASKQRDAEFAARGQTAPQTLVGGMEKLR